jgi:DNA-binding transcriptional ArsR family regulator
MAKLPTQLATQLPLKTRDALGHPVRREILRTLNAGADPRSAGEIAAAFPEVSLSVLTYHAQVLENRGTITVTTGGEEPGGASRLYSSTVSDDERIASILRATRESDRPDADPQ